MLVKYRFVIIIVLVALVAWFVISGTGGDTDETGDDIVPTVEITAGTASVRWDIDTKPLEERTQLAVCSYGGDMGEFFWYKAQEMYGGEERVPYQNGKQVNFSGGYVQAANGVVTVFNRLSESGYHTLTEDERAATVKKLLEELGLNPNEFKETAVSGGADGSTASRRATVTLSQAVSGIPVEGGGLMLGFNGNYVESITAGYNQVLRISVKNALTVAQLKQAFSTAVLNVTGGIEVPTSIIVSSYTATYRQDNSEKGGGKLYPYIVFEGTVSDGQTHGKFYSAPILMLVNEDK